MRTAITSLVLAALFASCSPEKPSAENSNQEKAADPIELHERVPDGWAHENFSKVVGYRFGGSGGSGDGYFTLCRDQKINLEELKQMASVEAELKPDQTTRLLNAVLGDADGISHVACYNPHHIFVFYAADGTARRAVEVCFECNGVQTVPRLPEDQFQKYDLVSLAKLCDQLGLWHEKKPADEYLHAYSEGWVDES